MRAINFGRLAYSDGDDAATEQWYKQALERAVATTFAYDVGIIQALLGQIALRRGDVGQAAVSNEEALAADIEAHDSLGECGDHFQLFTIATIARAQGREQDAITHLRACYRLAESIRAARSMAEFPPSSAAVSLVEIDPDITDERIIASLLGRARVAVPARY